MRKFNVGDVLKIREWEDMAQEFGMDADGHIRCDATFTKRMRRLCGATFTVKNVMGNDRYDSKEGVEGGWSISGDMLEYFDAEFDNDDSIILNESDVLQILTQK